jgi:hypothetical protein
MMISVISSDLKSKHLIVAKKMKKQHVHLTFTLVQEELMFYTVIQTNEIFLKAVVKSAL